MEQAGSGVDLFSWPFWTILLVAAVVLALRLPAVGRSVALATVNSLFLPIVAGWNDPGRILVVVGATWVSAIGLSTYLSACRKKGWLLVPLGTGLIVVFALHKRPDLVPTGFPVRATGTSLRFLGVIGFSYVALRFVELLRATSENRGLRPSAAAIVNYLVPFHMLAAGPIEAWDEFSRRPSEPEPPDLDAQIDASGLIANGLVKKFVLARFVSDSFLTGFASASFLGQWVEAQVFTLWLYLDFSGYADVAVGAGRLIGVPTPANFDRPLLSRNLVEFWERWHISLSRFIRRNVFIPLQMRMTRWRPKRLLSGAAVAFGVSFGLCGLWHGVTTKYLLWGLLHAAGLWVCTAFRTVLRKRLGVAGLARYTANRAIHVGAWALTYQFVSLSLWLVGR